MSNRLKKVYIARIARIGAVARERSPGRMTAASFLRIRARLAVAPR